MDELFYWRLCDELSILQAALLIIGHDPSGENCHVEKWQINERPHGYEAAKTAIINGLKNNNLDGYLHYFPDYDREGDKCGYTNEVDINSSTVSVEALKPFLRRRGICEGFFFNSDSDEPSYLNPENPNYAPKLAAAVRAWETITSNEALLNGKTPKQAIEKWLREHASTFNLTGTDGNPVAAAIEQISKVTNWRPEGGAAKTPTPSMVKSNPTPTRKQKEKHYVNNDIDDEIPF